MLNLLKPKNEVTLIRIDDGSMGLLLNRILVASISPPDPTEPTTVGEADLFETVKNNLFNGIDGITREINLNLNHYPQLDRDNWTWDQVKEAVL